MIHKTKGIVLHRFKYSDSKYIAKIYTKQFGLQSYIVFGANSKKGRMQINLLQPLFPLDMQVYHKETVELQKVKEIAVFYPVNSFSDDISLNIKDMFKLINKALAEMNSNLSSEYGNIDIKPAQNLEAKINKLRNQLREDHIANIKNKKYKYKAGVIYNELFSTSEKLGDYIINVSETIKEVKE